MSGAVLVVDDEPALRDLIAQVVESIDCPAMKASDGAEALRLFEAHHREIAVIISDVNMPVMDGFAFIRAAREIAPAVKVILSSGSLAEEEQRVAASLRVTSLLPKPYTARQLAECVRSALNGGGG